MRKADEFINEVEKLEIVPDDILRRLRKKVSSVSGGLSPQSVAKYLVKNEYISSAQAGDLLLKIENNDKVLLGEKLPFATEGDPDAADSPDPDKKKELSAPLSDIQRKELDDSLSAAAEVEGAGEPDVEAGKYGSRRHKHLKKAKGNEFDSPLMLIGSCALALLILVGGGLFYLLNSESGDELLNSAEGSFQAQSYSQAIAEYERFVEDFPTHAGWSKAKVMLAVARLRQVVEVGKDYETSLQVAQKEIPAIEDEPEFGVAQGDFAGLLPLIAKGLADKAERTSMGDQPADADPLVEKTNAALTLVGNTKYVPKSLRDDADLAEIREILARIKRRSEARVDLEEAIAGMTAATNEGQPRSAYALHSALLQKRPELRANEKLLEALSAAALAEQASIQFIEDTAAAESDERPSGVLTTVSSATQRLAGTANTDGVFVSIHGGVAYGLNAENGLLLWRRAVGVGARVVPAVYHDEDVLLIDHHNHDLLRLSGRNGKTIWRAELGGVSNRPILVRNRIIVAMESGRLLAIDLQSGEKIGHADFAQALRSAPTVSYDKRRLYLVGEHSSLYTLEAATMECLGVMYTGHSAGSIQIAPVQVANKLVLLENTGLETCLLRVYSFDQEGKVDQQIASVRLAGACQTEPAVFGRKLFVASQMGEAKLLEFTVDEGAEPVTTLASRPAGELSRPYYVAANEGGLWIADVGIGRYIPSVTDKRLVPQQLESPCPTDSFAGPLQTRENVVLHARRRADIPGIFLAATETKSGRIVWDTQLSVAPIGAPYVSSSPRGVVVADMLGEQRLLSRQEINARVSNVPDAVVSKKRFNHLIRFSDGSAAYCGVGEEEYQIASANADLVSKLRLLGPLACEPTPMDDAWLAPLSFGQIHCLAPDGSPFATPFQPSLEPGRTIDWLPVGVLQVEDSYQVVAATADGSLYSIQVSLGDTPQLALQNSVELEDPVVSQVAVIAGAAVGVHKSGSLGVYNLPSLEAQQPIEVTSPVVWGPYAAGDLVLIGTAADELAAIDPGQAKIAWQIPLDSRTPIGKPLVEDNAVTLVTRSGDCLHVETSSGEILGRMKLHELPGSGPVAYGERLLIYANDSTVLVTKRP